MLYRKLKDGNEVSLLGVGTMRLPVMENGKIDRAATTKMLRAAIDECGVNYVDTAYMYHGGESELAVGEALADGYREKVYLADKMPAWLAHSHQELYNIFNDQLKKLGTDHIDYYLVHNLDKGVWDIAKKHGIFDFLDDIKARGLVKHVGFSFHDELPLFKEIIDAYPWEFCQIQFNFMDTKFQAGLEGLRYAAEKGLAVIIMEPLKGGRLTTNVPPQIQALWDSAPVKRTAPEWALRFVADFPEVTCILSGMGSEEMLRQNVATLSEGLPQSLTSEEKAIIEKVADEYRRSIKYACTGCEYCLPCPAKINIPEIMKFVNESAAYGRNGGSAMSYTWVNHFASECLECHACEGHCPQHLPISSVMKEAVEIFGK